MKQDYAFLAAVSLITIIVVACAAYFLMPASKAPGERPVPISGTDRLDGLTLTNELEGWRDANGLEDLHITVALSDRAQAVAAALTTGQATSPQPDELISTSATERGGYYHASDVINAWLAEPATAAVLRNPAARMLGLFGTKRQSDGQPIIVVIID